MHNFAYIIGHGIQQQLPSHLVGEISHHFISFTADNNKNLSFHVMLILFLSNRLVLSVLVRRNTDVGLFMVSSKWPKVCIQYRCDGYIYELKFVFHCY